MSNTLVWFGPVFKPQIKDSIPEGYSVRILGCTGDGKPPHKLCSDFAQGWSAQHDGRPLVGLRKWAEANGGAIDGAPVLASFSAGGQVVKRLLSHPSDRAEIAGVYLGDATYTTTWKVPKKSAGMDPYLEWIVLYAMDVLAEGRGRWLVSTVSANPNHTPAMAADFSYPSGSQTQAVLWDEIERRTGQKFVLDDVVRRLLEGLRAPVRAGRIGPVVLIDFGSAYTHGQHATLLPVTLLRGALELLPNASTSPAAPAAPPPPSPSPAPSNDEAPNASTSAWKWGIGIGVGAAFLAWVFRR